MKKYPRLGLARQSSKYRYFATKPEGLSLILGPRRCKDKTSSKLFSELHMLTVCVSHQHTKKYTDVAKTFLEAEDTAQRLRALAALAEDLGSVPSTHTDAHSHP